MHKSGNLYTIEIKNPVEYASYVEFGHRTKSGGWVDGKYMLTISEERLKLAARCTVFPNLNDSELQQSYHVNGADNLIVAMLTPAEFDDYTVKIIEQCGFKTGDELVEEAKN